jgi:hypothetical protein
MDVASILKRASDKSGLTRVRYKERNVPTSVEGVTVLPFFGDRRSSFVLSSILLRRVREELKGSRYFVMVSWPGWEGMYPYVDEYWQPDDSSAVERLLKDASGFSNGSSAASLLGKSLNQYFYDVMSDGDLVPFYDRGLTPDFFERFRHVKVSLPSVPSASSLGSEVHRSLSRSDYKVFVRPAKHMFSWRSGSPYSAKAPREFWLEALGTLVSSGMTPVVYNDRDCHDLSSDAPAECLSFGPMEALKELALMRATDCVLDFFGSDSRMALAARCPFLCFDERQRFGALKEYEVNDLCGGSLGREYIFSFAALVEKGSPSVWKSNLLDHMVVRLDAMRSRLDRDSWPAPVESNEIVPYDSVRKRKLKRFGTRFIKIERD